MVGKAFASIFNNCIAYVGESKIIKTPIYYLRFFSNRQPPFGEIPNGATHQNVPTLLLKGRRRSFGSRTVESHIH